MDRLKEKVRELLKTGKAAGFVGYKMTEGGHVLPHFFSKARLEEVDEAAVCPGDARYPLDKLLQAVAAKYPEETFAILVRGCDERGLNELFKWGQLEPDKVVLVGIACPQELADYCECPGPYDKVPGPFASVIDYGEKCAPVKKSERVIRVDALAEDERFKEWHAHFDRCVKCYGCRDVCPMCFCKECSLEHPEFITTATLPPSNPEFHLARATHMAGRCIDCGLCEEACPADIPLRVLYKKGNQMVKELFGYETGSPPETKSPFTLLGDEVTLETKPL
jgi:formate dehydrogenase subunit beta